MSVGITLGQIALGQLAAVSSQSLDNMETRAHCMSLMGKYMRLLAVREDSIYLCSLWDTHKQVHNTKLQLIALQVMYMYAALWAIEKKTVETLSFK